LKDFAAIRIVNDALKLETQAMLHHGGLYHNRRLGGKPLLPTRDAILGLSLGLNVILVLSALYFATMYLPLQTNPPQVPNQSAKGVERVWNGGHPTQKNAGSCWCGNVDKYCMCTPNLAIDLIIVSGKNREYLWLVRRKDTNQLATMGGFVNVDETVEHAVKREIKEEMNIDLKDPPVLFGFYSDPRRDNRRRTASAVFAVYLGEDVHPIAGDDAKEVRRISMDEIEQHAYFSDHRTILLDYRRFVRREISQDSTEGDFAPDIYRSTCAKHSDSLFAGG
jgi:8-oxo-dGTP diphosphatase